jgi:hypothetical protein
VEQADAKRHRYPHGPYSMVGPVEVAAAMPGDVIECTMLALRTIDWGWNSFPLGVGALPSDFAQPYVHYFRFDDQRRTVQYTHGISLPMAPFLGVVAVEPAGDDQTSAILAGPYGGNLVLRDLHVGSSLFLPAAKPGGRIWIGDVHARCRATASSIRPRSRPPPRTWRSATTCTPASPWGAPGRDRRQLGLHLRAAEDRARGHPQGHLPARSPRSGPALAAPGNGVRPVSLSVADRLDILDLLARADAAASARDAAGYLALFTGDAVLDGDQGTYRGTEALGRGLAQVWGPRRRAPFT